MDIGQVFHAQRNKAELEDKTVRSKSFEFCFVLTVQFSCFPVCVKGVYITIYIDYVLQDILGSSSV